MFCFQFYCTNEKDEKTIYRNFFVFLIAFRFNMFFIIIFLKENSIVFLFWCSSFYIIGCIFHPTITRCRVFCVRFVLVLLLFDIKYTIIYLWYICARGGRRYIYWDVNYMKNTIMFVFIANIVQYINQKYQILKWKWNNNNNEVLE